MSSARQIMTHCVLVSMTVGAEGGLAQTAEDASPVELDFGASVSSGYTDNVYATENDKVGDLVTTLSSWAEISAETEAYEWSLGADLDLGRYASEGSEDYADATLRAEGRYVIDQYAFVFGGVDRAWEHEPRSSPESVNGIEPTEYILSGGFAGASLSFRRTGLRIGANIRSYDFGDVASGDGREINNDDRDRTVSEFGGRLGYEITPNRTVFVQGVLDGRDYDTATDDLGYERDSEGFRLGVGIAGKAGEVTGEAMIGVLSQDYEDPRFDSTTALDIDLDVTWRPSSRTRVTASLDRALEETTLYDSDEAAAASGYLSTSAGIRASHWVAGDLTVNGSLWFTENDYQTVSRTDYITEAGFGLRYHVTPHVFLGGAYSFEQRSSSAAGADYDEHSILISLGAESEPLDDGTGPRARFEQGGFYAGLGLGHGTLVTAVDGERGGTGALTADFGADGGSGGAFAGWRGEVGDMVVGAELGVDEGDAGWRHQGGRDFGVERGDSLGADLTFGFRVRNDALLYTRAGVVGTTFDTEYARIGEAAGRREREVGLRGGFGVELPIRESWSARMEYLLAAYPDYDLGVGGQSDNFANLETMARLGLVYSFSDRQRSDPAAASFDGAYGGIRVGHSVLSSENVGPRPGDLQTRFVLDVPRASGGAALGAYLGYGWTIGDLYVGGEIDGDLTSTNWNIERDPEGGIVSSDRRGGIGASLRAGYVVNDAFLLYVQAGVVRGVFETDYEAGGEAVSQDESLAGGRLGAGVEVPLSDGLHLRFDYSHAEFDSYEVEYAGGTDRFEPEENLFRVGLTKRF